ncbi:MAG: ABC transporter permease [Verrucomicrobia bacterium]|nr:ABC transporter permease [Verrucomicrobiota bacterium]
MNTWHKLKWPIIALALVLLFNFIFSSGFFQVEIKNGRLYGSLIDILHRAAPVMLISLGMTLVIATGGIDLSVGSVMAIAGAVAALLLTKTEQPVAMVIIISLAVSFLFGVWNGTLVGLFGITPIVATLILMVSGRGIAQLLTDGQIVTFDNSAFEFIGRGALLGLPFTIWLVLFTFILLTVFTKKTAVGLFIEATGDNEKASAYAGVNTNVVKMLVYAICSLLAGLAGLIVATDIKAADANNAGQWIELDAILAVVIGGTALTGGRFFFAGSLLGATLIQALTTTILTRGVPVQWTLVVKALVIIAVCLLQSETFRRFILPRWKKVTV